MHLPRVFSSNVLTLCNTFSLRTHLSTVQVAGMSRGGFSADASSPRWLRFPGAYNLYRPVSNAASATAAISALSSAPVLRETVAGSKSWLKQAQGSLLNVTCLRVLACS